MNNKKVHFLIMGSGVIGQVYGAHLHMAGHRVTFFTREKYLAQFREEGIKIQLAGSKEKMHIKDGEFISEIKSLDGIDYLFICFRADQRDEASLLLKDLDCSQVQLVLCFPIWNKNQFGIERNFHGSYSLMPGISGVYRGREIYFKKGITQVGPLFNASPKETKNLCSILSNAGLPSKLKPDLIRDIQIIMGIGFPFFAALSTKDYKLNDLVKDKGLLSIAAKSQKECLNIIRAGGDPLGILGNLAVIAPSSLWTLFFKLTPYFLKGFNRAMVEVHFKKVHRQTIFLLRELASFPFSNRAKKDNLQELLSLCT